MDYRPRVLVWFSCGAASAVAAKMAIRFLSRLYRVLIVCCDTRPSEHPDNLRFSADCEKWFGQPITYIRNSSYDSVDDVFEGRRYMSGTHGAQCTTLLKKQPRLDFQRSDDIHVFGFTSDEKTRIKKFAIKNPALQTMDLLADLQISKSDCYRMVKDAGIELPAMYLLGFNNNNCPGCVKSSSPWYWSMVRKHFPEVFQRRCEQSRAIGCRLVEIKHHVRIFLDELPDREFKPPRKKENLSCGPECGGKSTRVLTA